MVDSKEKIIEGLHQILRNIKTLPFTLQDRYSLMEENVLMIAEEYNINIEKDYLTFIIMERYKKNIEKKYEELKKIFQEIIIFFDKNDDLTQNQISIVTNKIKKNINEIIENNNIDDIISNEIHAIMVRHANGNLKFSRDIIKIRKEIEDVVKSHCQKIEIHMSELLENDVNQLLKFEIKKKKSKKKISYFKYGFLTASIVIGGFLSFDIYTFFRDRQNTNHVLASVSTKVNLQKKVSVAAPEAKSEIQKLKEINSDAIAWIKVNGTDIDHSVVQTTDNKYYLNRDIYKEYNENGWVFMDYRNTGNFDDKNTVIYGHNSAPMFASLKNTLTQNWFNQKENHYITTITEKGTLTWEIFSTYTTKVEDYYITTKFSTDSFKKFVNTVKSRSIFNYGVEVSENDQILTLSTCNKGITNGRTVVHARLMSD